MTPDLAEAHERVRQEWQRFERKLPQLLQEIPRKWAIFLNDEVQGVFGTSGEAYGEAVRRFGLYGGFVIAQVVPVKSIYVPSCWVCVS